MENKQREDQDRDENMILMQILNKFRDCEQSCSDFRRCLVFATLKLLDFCMRCVNLERFSVKYTGVFLNDCRGFNNFSYTVHLR